MSTPSEVLRVENLGKSYFLGKQEVPVLSEINLSVQKGEYVAIMGQSGAGKSTLLNILGCLDTPTSGKYVLAGRDVAGLSANKLAEIRNREIGFIFQNFNLLPKLSMEGNVELPLIYAGLSARERKSRVENVLKRFGLFERKKHLPNEISGGQKQRAAIARALVKSPSIILADEPTGNLDSHTTEEILAVFTELHREGNTLIVITHETHVADRAERIIELKDGGVLSDTPNPSLENRGIP